MPNPGRKVVLRRDNSEPSPKVAVPSAITLLVAVVWAAIQGQIDPEQAALAVAAVVQFVLGYFKKDTVDVDDLEDALVEQEPA